MLALAMKERSADAGLGRAEGSNERTGIVAGSGGRRPAPIVQSAIIAKRRAQEDRPLMVAQGDVEHSLANLATPPTKIKASATR